MGGGGVISKSFSLFVQSDDPRLPFFLNPVLAELFLCVCVAVALRVRFALLIHGAPARPEAYVGVLWDKIMR